MTQKLIKRDLIVSLIFGITSGYICLKIKEVIVLNYYISDLHLLHENVLRFDNRPFESIKEMQETIVNNWNRKVTNGDTVYILGDVSMRGKKEDLRNC